MRHKVKQKRRIWSVECIFFASGKCHAAMLVKVILNRSLNSENYCHLSQNLLLSSVYDQIIHISATNLGFCFILYITAEK